MFILVCGPFIAENHQTYVEDRPGQLSSVWVGGPGHWCPLWHGLSPPSVDGPKGGASSILSALPCLPIASSKSVQVCVCVCVRVSVYVCLCMCVYLA